TIPVPSPTQNAVALYTPSAITVMMNRYSAGMLTTTAPKNAAADPKVPREADRCGCWNGLSPGRETAYGDTTDEMLERPSPERNRLAGMPTIGSSRYQLSIRASVSGIEIASTGIATSATGIIRPKRSESPRTPLATWVQKAVES